MIYRVESAPLTTDLDAPGRAVKERIRSFLGIELDFCRIVHVFTVSGLNLQQIERLIEEKIWHDPISQRIAIGKLPCLEPLPDWFCEISLKPGVTDNEARTALETAKLALAARRNNFTINTAIQYRLGAPGLSKIQVERLCRDLLCNELIQHFEIRDLKQWREEGFPPVPRKIPQIAEFPVEEINLASLDDQGLEHLSAVNTWALNLREMRTIRNWYQNPEVRKKRAEAGMPFGPTDVEMETLAQTWSEHCKHKIFSSHITLVDKDSGRTKVVDNLYKTCIRKPTAILRQRMGENDFCHSVFKDNAGVIAFINGYDVCIKVETHNSPSALDPYGGALTGIVGVNRDPMGCGMGADLVCNLDVFCFCQPDYDRPLPPRILHPARIFEGVRKGIEDGGNQSGIPTVNGSIVFDDRFLGKPLVFCGTVGLLPVTVCGHPGYEKAAMPGDAIVMVGGRIGKDGIHGATFSSEELHVNSPSTAVQIGDPITQRKMYDFIIRARDKCLYHAITDNGAGGLASSVGEMAQDTGGCEIDLALAPTKYPGLVPWEILLSEAQERMTLAVPPDKLGEFLALAKHMDVEATALGHFTESGYFDIRYGAKRVGLLDMVFLHDGSPQLRLEAEWKKPEYKKLELNGVVNDPAWQGEFLKKMLARFNIRSKESIIRQYDHEVRGGSVIKPLCGVLRDAPTDGAVLRPLVESDAGIVLAHGICPRYSDYDAYWMVANAMDEAIRNAVAVGANPDALAGVDNFCWPDPIFSQKNPEGKFKLAQLVRACAALKQFSLAYGVPCISGKDSMKNDYLDESGRISIPPTVLFTVLGVIGNVTKTQTSDFKRPGDAIYILGGTWPELGASEAANALDACGGYIPRVDAASALTRYRALHSLMLQKTVSACHDCSDGGLAVTLAEMCIGGRLGCVINMDNIPAYGDPDAFGLLYSESASRHVVTVRKEFEPLMEALGMWQICRRIGQVTGKPQFVAQSGDSPVMDVKTEELAKAFSQSF